MQVVFILMSRVLTEVLTTDFIIAPTSETFSWCPSRPATCIDWPAGLPRGVNVDGTRDNNNNKTRGQFASFQRWGAPVRHVLVRQELRKEARGVRSPCDPGFRNACQWVATVHRGRVWGASAVRNWVEIEDNWRRHVLRCA